jgi:hypothetical protein
VSWLTDEFFIGHPGPPEQRPQRPISQGDVFPDVPIAGRPAKNNNNQVFLAGKTGNALVVGSSCGMRKEGGELNDVIHAAPISKLASLAPGWAAPWDGRYAVLPLPGLVINGEDGWAANLARIGQCATASLVIDQRLGCVSLAGMESLKARVAHYFVRVHIPTNFAQIGAHEEWHEIDLWERWTIASGSPDGFQVWLDEENPNYSPRSRRDTLYDDLGGIRTQLDELFN